METEIIKKYYDTGELMYEYSYFNGIKNGLQKWYYKDGQLDREYYMENGIYHGTCQTWVSDGIRWSIREWKNGEVNGLEIRFRYGIWNLK